MKPISEIQTLPEHEFVTLTGLSREVVRAARAECLTEGEDWTRIGGFIVLYPVGAEKLKRQLGVEAGIVVETPPVGPKPTAILKVRSLPRNQRILLCDAPGAKEGAPAVRCRVKSNLFFAAGMDVPAVHIAGDMYEFDSYNHRPPMRKGRYPRERVTACNTDTTVRDRSPKTSKST